MFLQYSTLVRKAVLLDRDGTIIDNQGDLGNPDGVNLVPGAKEGVQLLKEQGWLLVVVTNQAGVARGAFTESDISQVHNRIDSLLAMNGVSPIEKYYYCCYHPDGPDPDWMADHPNRKPKSGMLLEAAEEFKLDLTKSWMIGDTDRDIEAGKNAGCKTVWLTGPNRVTDVAKPTLYAPSLLAAAKFIVAESKL